jgi:hypothetical protein
MEERFQNSAINAVIEKAFAKIEARRRQMIQDCIEEARINNTNVITIRKPKLIDPMPEEQ